MCPLASVGGFCPNPDCSVYGDTQANVIIHHGKTRQGRQRFEYQMLTAKAAWCGQRIDGVHALASHPLVMLMAKAEAIYDEMSGAMCDYLPERLLL